jgi:branched-chain amino acid transport system substrate-binding protein
VKKGHYALVVLAAFVVVLMAFVAGCGGDSTDTTGTTAGPATTAGDATTTTGESGGASEPIKIGFMAPYVGVYADLGQDMENGFKLYLDEIGSKAAGREIILLTEDTQAKPELGPSIATKFIDSEKVDIIAGIIHSGVALSIRDIVDQNKVPLIITNAGAAALTGELKSPYIFRTSFANGQQDLAGGWYAYNTLGYKKMIVLAPDYSAGHEKADGFMKSFKAAGGTVAEEIYPPLETSDFASYLTQISSKAGEIDAVWAFFAGSGAIKLINQYAEYGLKDQIPLFILGDTVDDALLPAMGESAVGIQNYLHYSASLDTPVNKAFVDAYMAKYNKQPSLFSEQAYVGAKTIVMALEAVQGDMTDPDAFCAALRTVTFEAPRGPFRFDENQNVIEPVYIREVQMVDGEPLNVVKYTIPDVSQNWEPPK